MELGLDFDDSDFADKVREKKILTSYNAKVCYDEWFLSPKADNGKNDPATLYKFRADHHYLHHRWDEALLCYRQVLGSLGSQNKTMRREVQECIIRCYVHLTQFTEAIQAMDHLIADCVTVDHLCQALMLKQRIYQSAGIVKEEIKVLQQLINLHPLNAFFWNSLGQAYEKIRHPVTDNHLQNHGKKLCSTEGVKSVTGVIHTFDEQKYSSESSKDIKTEMSEDGTTSRSEDTKSEGTVAPETELVRQMGEKLERVTVASLHEKSLDHAVVQGYPLDLVLLTCYIRTRLILMSTQGTVGTLIKERNVQLTRKMDRKIEALSVTEQEVQAADQFMREDMFDEDKNDESSTDQTCDAKVLIEQGVSLQEFNKRWFGWIQDKPP